MRRRSIQGVLLVLFFAAVTTLTLAGFLFHGWMPPVATEHGRGVDAMIAYILIATGAIFVVGHVVLATFVWKYQGEGSSVYRKIPVRTELVWALIPVVVMALVAEGGSFFLGLPVWAKMYAEPARDALVVEVVGKQFEWIVRYPGKDGKFGAVKPELVDDAENPLGLDEEDGAATDDLVFRGSLHLPVGRPILIRARSLDVLHSFSVPEFRVKQDTVPGMATTVQFKVERTGTFEIACAELCGLGHYRMRGFVYVKSDEEYRKWFDQQVGWFE